MFIIPNLSAYVSGAESITSETAQELNRVEDSLAELFSRNGWTWSGEVPSRDTIGWKVLHMVVETCAILATSERESVTLHSGRLSVECTRSGIDNVGAAVTVFLSFAV